MDCRCSGGLILILPLQIMVDETFSLEIYERLLASFAFVMGAVVGSFLNVCIYRMPLGLSVNNPRRSFCPHCKVPIPWYRNIPLVSWLLLRGRCAKCGATIPFRYFFVELLTACLFLAVWNVFPLFEALALFVLVSLLIVATFIDFDYYIIPDEVTWGGVVAGLILSLLVPELTGSDNRLLSLVWSLVGAATGFFALWGVVEVGKILFGKKRITFDKVEPFVWKRSGDTASLKIGDESLDWYELFTRDSDQLILETSGLPAAADTDTLNADCITFHYNKVSAGDKTLELVSLNSITGKASAVIIPREAMGFGDVKFIAAIGAFLGWKAVFFTIFSASILGAVVGIVAILAGRREWSAKIPFGPYLALGAVLWMFFGTSLLEWYLSLLVPTQSYY